MDRNRIYGRLDRYQRLYLILIDRRCARAAGWGGLAAPQQRDIATFCWVYCLQVLGTAPVTLAIH